MFLLPIKHRAFLLLGKDLWLLSGLPTPAFCWWSLRKLSSLRAVPSPTMQSLQNFTAL